MPPGPNSVSHERALSLGQSRLAKQSIARSRYAAVWWSQTGSNRRPPACKAGALPTELWPRASQYRTATTRPPSLKLRRTTFAVRRLARQPKRRQPRRLVGLGRFELPTSRLSSARSNQLSYKPGSENSRIRNGRRRTDDASSVVCRPISVIQICLLNSSFVKKEKRRRRCPANGQAGLRPIRPDVSKRSDRGA